MNIDQFAKFLLSPDPDEGELTEAERIGRETERRLFINDLRERHSRKQAANRAARAEIERFSSDGSWRASKITVSTVAIRSDLPGPSPSPLPE